LPKNRLTILCSWEYLILPNNDPVISCCRSYLRLICLYAHWQSHDPLGSIIPTPHGANTSSSCIDCAISRLNNLHKELEGLHTAIPSILGQVSELSNEFIEIEDAMTKVKESEPLTIGLAKIPPKGSINMYVSIEKYTDYAL
jgi:hypothetical protein